MAEHSVLRPALARLDDAGLTVSRPDPLDGRARRRRLTAAGHAAVKDFLAAAARPADA